MKRERVLEKWLQFVATAALGIGLVASTGCGGGQDHDHDPHHGHVHHAPHGGALSMLGDHAFQLELVADAGAETLRLYVLDGEAERFVRIAAPEIQANAIAGRQEWELQFKAVSHEATGESIGDSSQFNAAAPELAKQSKFEVRIEQLEILGQTFEDVSIPYPEGKH